MVQKNLGDFVKGIKPQKKETQKKYSNLTSNKKRKGNSWMPKDFGD